jgi:hypothetical protein
MASTLNYANTLSPKTARSVLVPPDATDVPAAVMEANRPAVEKVEALERAGQAVRDARRVADDAPRRDQAARVAAHQAGKKLPAQRSRTRTRRSRSRNGPATCAAAKQTGRSATSTK